MSSEDEYEYEDSDLDDAEASMCNSSTDQISVTKSKQGLFHVLTRDDIVNAQAQKMDDIVELFDLKRREARLLLMHFSWDMEQLKDKCFSDMHGVFSLAGIQNAQGDDDVAACHDDVDAGKCGMCLVRACVRCVTCGRRAFLTDVAV